MRDTPRSAVARFAFRAGFLVALAILLSLGTWQVQRLAWKESLIAQREAQMRLAPMPIETLDNLRTATHAPNDPPFAVEFHPVSVTGRLVPGKEMYFLATDGGQPGFHVYQPLLLANGRHVIVNRGFVPEQFKDPATRPGGDPGLTGETELSITGLARDALYEKPGALLPDNEPAKGLYFWKDWRAMVAQAGLDPATTYPFFIDAGETPPGAWPKGGITIIDLPNNHLQYAVTWYGLAAALVGVALAMRLRRRRTS